MAPCTTSQDKDKLLAADIKSSSGGTKLRTANCFVLQSQADQKQSCFHSEDIPQLIWKYWDLKASQ